MSLSVGGTPFKETFKISRSDFFGSGLESFASDDFDSGATLEGFIKSPYKITQATTRNTIYTVSIHGKYIIGEETIPTNGAPIWYINGLDPYLNSVIAKYGNFRAVETDRTNISSVLVADPSRINAILTYASSIFVNTGAAVKVKQSVTTAFVGRTGIAKKATANITNETALVWVNDETFNGENPAARWCNFFFVVDKLRSAFAGVVVNSMRSDSQRTCNITASPFGTNLFLDYWPGVSDGSHIGFVLVEREHYDASAPKDTLGLLLLPWYSRVWDGNRQADGSDFPFSQIPPYKGRSYVFCIGRVARKSLNTQCAPSSAILDHAIRMVGIDPMTNQLVTGPAQAYVTQFVSSVYVVN